MKQDSDGSINLSIAGVGKENVHRFRATIYGNIGTHMEL